jgi:hypothetical protein
MTHCTRASDYTKEKVIEEEGAEPIATRKRKESYCKNSGIVP